MLLGSLVCGLCGGAGSGSAISRSYSGVLPSSPCSSIVFIPLVPTEFATDPGTQHVFSFCTSDIKIRSQLIFLSLSFPLFPWERQMDERIPSSQWEWGVMKLSLWLEKHSFEVTGGRKQSSGPSLIGQKKGLKSGQMQGDDVNWDKLCHRQDCYHVLRDNREGWREAMYGRESPKQRVCITPLCNVLCENSGLLLIWKGKKSLISGRDGVGKQACVRCCRECRFI